jgi:hypothetical protein
VDQAHLISYLKFLAEITDVNIQYIAFAAEIITPDPVKNHFTGQHLAVVP